MKVEESKIIENSTWKVDKVSFLEWLKNREHVLEPGLSPVPTIKVLIFLALLDAKKECSYHDIQTILEKNGIIKGFIPNNTLRTSVLSLSKTLDRFSHSLELKSFRGRFKLVKRISQGNKLSLTKSQGRIVLLLDPPAIKAEDIALILIKKAMLPFQALYFLEWSARWWETYSGKEADIRVTYETGAWERLGICDRLNVNKQSCLGFVGLAPGEGLAEIEFLKKILRSDSNKKIHYLAVDSSPRLLRDHIGLLKETLTAEIENGQLICAGIIADIFSNLPDALRRVRQEFKNRGIIESEMDFLAPSQGLLITYLGNCLGNNYQDQETEIFSIIHSTFPNRPLEFLVGVSVMQAEPDIYKRNWDDFLLQTPRHLLETKKLLRSARPNNSDQLPEFLLSEKNHKNDRCPSIIPEPYVVRHLIQGCIYRFYYRLAFDLALAEESEQNIEPLPKGSLILLYNIIKYDISTLVKGIEKCGLVKVRYDQNYHQIIKTQNGKREYAVFSAYCEKE